MPTQVDDTALRALFERRQLPSSVHQLLVIESGVLLVTIEPPAGETSSRNGNGLAAAAHLTPTEAQSIADQIGADWRAGKRTAQLRFVQRANGTTTAVYTVAAGEALLASLIAAPETGAGPLRDAAARVAALLKQPVAPRVADDPEVTVLIDAPLPPEISDSNPFALAWRPRRPLPAALHRSLSRAIERLASANACHVRHLSIRAEYVQLVVACPAGQTSAWVAHTFKKGSETEIQKQYRISVRLWADGYFARESLEPLAAEELRLFLRDA